MEAVEINGGQDIGDIGSSNVEFGQEFNLSARNLWINAQLSSHRYKILLENLERDYPGACLAMRGH